MNTGNLLRVLICAVLFLMCGKPAAAGQQEKSRYNVVLICIDALRAGHLGSYGYRTNVSPVIDGLARQGVLFTRAFSPATWTLPSIASLFTSRYVPQHRVFNMDSVLSDQEITLAEILKIYGYRTAAFTSGIFLNEKFNLDQGFDVYEDIPLDFRSEIPRPPKRPARDMFPEISQWITKEKRNTFFLFVHFMEPHPPLYLPSDGDDNVFDPAYTGVIDGVSLDLRLRNRVFGNVLSLGDRDPVLLRPEDKRHILSHYDAAIQYVDRYVGKIMDELAKAGLVDKSIVIITADHGLDILEHNTLFNYSSQAPYEEIAHVPLIIVHPGKNERGVKVHRPVCLIDVLPTVLDCLNIPPKADAEGVSLAPLLEGRGESGTGDRIIYSTGSGERLRNIDSCSWAVQEKEWKLIIRPQYHYPLVELYNIRKDPAETTDRARQETGIADRLFMRYLHSLKKMNGDRQDDAED